MLKESPKQYSARRLRVKLEYAKAAVMAAQEELTEFRGKTADYQQLLDSVMIKLDRGWAMAFDRENRERARIEALKEAGDIA